MQNFILAFILISNFDMQVCNTVPKEICMLKLINPHPVKKPIQLKWCTKKKPEIPSYGAPTPDSYGSPRPPPSGYLPARYLTT